MGARGPRSGDRAKLKSAGPAAVIEYKKPSPEKYLCDDAKKLFRKLARELKSILVCVDSHALSRYCHAAIRYAEAARTIQESGPYLFNPDGSVRRSHPAVKEIETLAKIMHQLETELCMTPNARSKVKVKVEAEAEADPQKPENTSLLD